jgi:hypothetical protein
MALFLLLNGFFFTQQNSWTQDQLEFLLSVNRDIHAIAFNSAGISLVHFLCTLIAIYSLLPCKVENTKIES